MGKKYINLFPQYLPGLFVGLLFLSYSNVCYAAYTVDTGLPWDSFLTVLVTEFEGPIPKIMAIVAVVMAGAMLMFGETGGLFKKSLQIVFGVAIAINVGSWVTYLMSGTAATTGDSSSVSAVGSMTSSDFLGNFMNNLIHTCQVGAYKLQPYALKLLGVLAVLEMALAVAFNFDQDHIKYIFKETLKIGFFVFLVNQWVGGTYGIANNIFISFETLGYLASGMEVVSVNSITSNAYIMIEKIYSETAKLDIRSIGLILVNILVMIGMVLSIFFMVIQIVITKIEFWVISLLTIPLIPFGINKHTRFLFEKATGAVFSLGIKVMVLSFVASISANVLESAAAGVKTATSVTTGLSGMLQLLLGCLVMFVLVKKAPDLAQGLLSGSPSLSGGDMKQAAGAATGAAVAVASGGIAAAGKMALATAMPGGRNSNGSISAKGTLKNMGKMAMAKISSPYHDSIDKSLYKMQKRHDNNDRMGKSKDVDHGVYGPHRNFGDEGAAIKEKIEGRSDSGGSNSPNKPPRGLKQDVADNDRRHMDND